MRLVDVMFLTCLLRQKSFLFIFNAKYSNIYIYIYIYIMFKDNKERRLALVDMFLRFLLGDRTNNKANRLEGFLKELYVSRFQSIYRYV